MSRLKSKTSHHMWTDEEKEQLIRDVTQARNEGQSLKHYLGRKGVNDSWFRRMERVYMAEHPEFDPAKKTGRGSGWPVDPEERKREMARRVAKRQLSKPAGEPLFASRPDADKATMIKAYDSLPSNDEKKVWRERYGVTSAMLAYYHRILPARVKTLNVNGSVRDQRITHLLEPVPVMNLMPNSVPAGSAPVTLDDAILAFEVKLDHMREFTDQLKRMRGGR